MERRRVYKKAKEVKFSGARKHIGRPESDEAVITDSFCLKE